MVPLSVLEKQLIRSSIFNKTDMEIALLLERPVEVVTPFISTIWEGDTDTRNRLIIEKRKDADKPKKKKGRPVSMKKASLSEKYHADRKTARDKERGKILKTKIVDYSKMKSVKVDDKTYIQIPIGASCSQAIATYKTNRENYLKKINLEFNN